MFCVINQIMIIIIVIALNFVCIGKGFGANTRTKLVNLNLNFVNVACSSIATHQRSSVRFLHQKQG